MNVSGSVELAASRDALHAVLADPARLVELLPHVDALSFDAEAGGDAFSATIRPAIALGEIPFRTRWQRVANEPDLLRYHVEGRADEHWLGMDLAVALRPRDGGTLVAWDAACRFTGTMRTAGQRVLPAIVGHQARLVLEAAGRAAVAPG